MSDDLKFVKGPDGHPLNITNLPKIGTNRWVIRRKAEVVAAVNGGLLTIMEACERYDISFDEFLSWQTLVRKYGVNSLRITKLSEYRRYD